MSERFAGLSRPVLLAVPGLALAGAGLIHPHHLTYASSARWFWLHLGGLVIFPFVGWALASLVDGRHDLLAWATRASAYAYATFYTALDVVSGITAGYVTHELGPEQGHSDSVHLIFRIGTRLGNIGSWSLIVCVALIALDSVVRHGLRGVVSIALLPGAWLVHRDHIFSPYGVGGMVLIGLATGALGWIAPFGARLPKASRRLNDASR